MSVVCTEYRLIITDTGFGDLRSSTAAGSTAAGSRRDRGGTEFEFELVIMIIYHHRDIPHVQLVLHSFAVISVLSTSLEVHSFV